MRIMSCSWLVSVGSQSDLGWLAHSLVGSGFCFDLSLFEIASPKNDSFIVSSDFCDYFVTMKSRCSILEQIAVRLRSYTIEDYLEFNSTFGRPDP